MLGDFRGSLSLAQRRRSFHLRPIGRLEFRSRRFRRTSPCLQSIRIHRYVFLYTRHGNAVSPEYYARGLTRSGPPAGLGGGGRHGSRDTRY